MNRALMIGGLTAAAWMLAWSGSLWLGQHLTRPAAAPEAVQATTPRVRTPDRDHYTASLISRDLFGLTGTQTTTTSEALPFSAVLLATVVADPAQDSSALIQIDEQARGYGLGDALSSEATLTDIQPRAVQIRYRDQLHTLRLTRQRGDVAPPSAPQARLSRADLSDLIAAGGGGLRVVPHRDGQGEVDGYRISGIRRRSVLFGLGAKNGDIIHRINDRPISSLSEAMAAQEALSEADELAVEITRRGRAMTLSVLVE